jgi:cation transporter-like permease
MVDHTTVDISYPSLNNESEVNEELYPLLPSRSGTDSYPLLNPIGYNSDRSAFVEKQKNKKEERVGKPNIFVRCYRSYFKEEKGDSYVDTLLKANALSRAVKFFPALFITFGIELGNSFVLGSNEDILSKHFTLVLFIPVISAIAGNVGLQTSSSVTSFLNLRMIDKAPYSVWKLMWKYVAHCFLQMIVLSAMMGGLADIWQRDNVCRHSHGIIVLFGSMVNMMIASVAGVGTPILLNNFGYDPSSGAGPFETALQDVVGAIFFVYFAKWVLSFHLMGCTFSSTVCLKEINHTHKF